jgi:hypothetical protein
VKPAVEGVGVTKTRQIAPGPNQRLLDRVTREVRVPEDQAGGEVQPRERQVHERREGVMIAPACPLDETSLVHCPPRMWRGLVTAVHRV